MSSGKIIALGLVVISIAAIWLDSQNKLVPVFAAISSGTPTLAGAGKFAVAFLIYLLALSLLSPEAGFALTVLLIAGALIINQKNAPSGQSFLSLLFGGNIQPGNLLPGG